MSHVKLVIATDSLLDELHHEVYEWATDVHPKFMIEDEYLVWIVEYLANARGFTQFEDRADYG